MAKPQKVDVYLTLFKTDTGIVPRGAAAKPPNTVTSLASGLNSNMRVVHFTLLVDEDVFDQLIETDAVFDVGRHMMNSAPIVAHLQEIARDLA